MFSNYSKDRTQIKSIKYPNTVVKSFVSKSWCIVDIVIGPCIDGSIRIIPSNARSVIKGRVEVCFNGIWGTICSLNWDDQDASVACKQLGYSAEGSTQILKCICNAFFTCCEQFTLTIGALSIGSYHDHVSNVHIIDISCTGFESSVFDCPHTAATPSQSCPNNADAYIQCNGKCILMIKKRIYEALFFYCSVKAHM